MMAMLAAWCGAMCAGRNLMEEKVLMATVAMCLPRVESTLDMAKARSQRPNEVSNVVGEARSS